MHGKVHSIVYLGAAPVQSLNWVQLVGLPEVPRPHYPCPYP